MRRKLLVPSPQYPVPMIPSQENLTRKFVFLVQMYYNVCSVQKAQCRAIMIKHYILSLNPTAKHEWDRCILRDPLTAKRPDIAKLVSEAVGADTGSYLISVNIEVQVLEQAAVPQSEQLSLQFPEVSVSKPMREAA